MYHYKIGLKSVLVNWQETQSAIDLPASLQSLSAAILSDESGVMKHSPCEVASGAQAPFQAATEQVSSIEALSAAVVQNNSATAEKSAAARFFLEG